MAMPRSRPSRLASVLVACLLAAGSLLALAPAVMASEYFHTMAVGDEDPGGGFEPHVLAGPSFDGSGEWYFYDSPTGLGGTQGGNLWISKDYGFTWEWIDKDSVIGSSGDSFTAISRDGNIYYTDLYLSSASVDTSLDGGATWVANPLASQYVLDDRQWLDIGPSRDGIGDETLYLSFNQIPSGLVMVKAPITTGNEIPYVWQECAVFDTEARFRDNHAVDEVTGMVYIANSQNNGLHVLVSDDGCYSFDKVQVNSVAGGELQNIFAIIDTDMAGNVYVAWATPEQIWLAVSNDLGQTWTEHQVTETTRVRALPWLAAGDDGRLAIAYYETVDVATGSSDGQEGWWDVKTAVTLDALNETPEFTFMTVDEDVHKGGIQTTGTGGGSDRDLGDFLTVDIDHLGRILVSYGRDEDDGANARGSRPMFGGQIKGPYLREGMGPDIVYELRTDENRVTLNLSGLRDHNNDTIVNITVDWGDNTTLEQVEGMMLRTHLYPDREASYNLTISATNIIGMSNALTVTVNIVPGEDAWELFGLPGLAVVGGGLILLIVILVVLLMRKRNDNDDELGRPEHLKAHDEGTGSGTATATVPAEDEVLDAEQ